MTLVPPEADPGASRKTPLQNRVLPTGEIVAVPERGLLMGNRGCIARPDRTLGVTRWRTKMWIACVLDWRGRQRDVMPPGRWTALFFLDEATALAAGHRPCGYCRRADHRWLARSWQAARQLDAPPHAGEMDQILHAERVESRARRKILHPATAADLPDGAMAWHDGAPALFVGGTLRRWSLEGYAAPVPVGARTRLQLLTPPSLVAALSAGYRPLVHPSAGATPLRSFPGAPA